MNRRDFLKLSSFAFLTPVGLSTTSGLAAKPAFNPLPVLILVELNGGNDSHNTVLDLSQQKAYQQLRPQLALSIEEQIALDHRFTLNSGLKGFKGIWQRGELALVHGLGYPNLNKSHFRSIEIWDRATDAQDYSSIGWLANILPQVSDSSINALTFGRNSSVFSGGESQHIQLSHLKNTFRILNNSLFHSIVQTIIR